MERLNLFLVFEVLQAVFCSESLATVIGTDDANRVTGIKRDQAELQLFYDSNGNVTEAAGVNQIGITIREPARIGGNHYESQVSLVYTGQSVDSLTVFATSSNPLIVPSGSLSFSGSGTTRTLKFSKAFATTGNTRLQVIATDGVVSNQNSIIVEATSASVVGAFLFYNNSVFDGNDPGANADDDNAIAPDKAPLLQAARATFANYSSYSRGINGVMFDVSEVPVPTLSVLDFTFTTGNTNTPDSWGIGTEPSSITIREDAGANGSDRITLIWPDNAIQNTWLQITLLANQNTGLSSSTTYIFGHALAEGGNHPSNAQIDTTDIILPFQNQTAGGAAGIDSPYDYNRDGTVDTTDIILAFQNQTGSTTAVRIIDLTSPVAESRQAALSDSRVESTSLTQMISREAEIPLSIEAKKGSLGIQAPLIPGLVARLQSRDTFDSGGWTQVALQPDIRDQSLYWGIALPLGSSKQFFRIVWSVDDRYLREDR